ncbi:MAG: AMP-binding protein [Actinobacteria bacterium]|nr:AMP-binding protein [Actinomycetota bacterium]
MRIGDLLDRDARLYADEPAVVIVDGPAVTYRQLRARVGGLATALIDRGVTAGDRVVVMAGNSLTPFDAYLACAYAGAAAVPVNTRLAAPEIVHIVEDAAPSFALADPNYVEILASVLDDSIPLIATDSTDYQQMLARAEEPSLASRASASDIALIIYTSGTTGRPKGVCLSQAALTFNAVTMAMVQRFVPTDVFMTMTPLYHAATGTRVVSMIVDGQTHVVLPRFDAGEALAAIERYGVTTTIAVPTQLRRMLDVPDRDRPDLSSLRLLVYGAAPTGLTLIRRAIEELPGGMYQGYGLSEATTNLTGLLPEEHRPDASDELLRSAGRPVPGVTIAIRDEHGSDLAPGEVGELCVRSDKLMAGYWRNPEATAEVLIDGWLRTGDLGRMDEAGYVWIVDRAKDMLISGGVNVYPSEIEAVIREIEGVAEVAVVARPDDEWGEVPVAFVAPTAGRELDVDLLRERCVANLAKLKVPTAFHVVDEFPRTASGKIRKIELRERLTEEGVVDGR